MIMRFPPAHKLLPASLASVVAVVLLAALVVVPIVFAAEVRYHGNVDSKIYHQRSCRYFNCKHCTREFSTKQEAEKAGYRACKVCKP